MRLKLLEIRNFGCFGSGGIVLPIDDIVVLIGANNTGKSSVLSAYEAFAASGESLTLSAFHNEICSDPIEIVGLFSDVDEDGNDKKLAKWVYDDDTHGRCLKYKYIWNSPGKGEKQSWDPEKSEWVKGGMGGFDSIIQHRIPTPIRISPFSNPTEIESLVREILIDFVKEQAKASNPHIDELIQSVTDATNKIRADFDKELERACSAILKKLSDVFPVSKLELIAESKFNPESIIGTNSYLQVTKTGSAPIRLDRQGSGFQRTAFWAAMSALAELGRVKRGRTAIEVGNPKLLLIDEPEAFLHPPAVRDACDALYGLAELANWQVMITTHSPLFIDVSRDHTTLVRLRRSGRQLSTFSSSETGFTEDEKANLRMIRVCNPLVNEFFFPDRAVLVEGDTEEVVIRALVESMPHKRDILVVNCGSKFNLPLFMKIMNHFGMDYIVIHDSDCPRARRKGNLVANAAWTLNQRIAERAAEAKGKSSAALIVHIPNFELDYFGESPTAGKPDSALDKLADAEFMDSASGQRLAELVSQLSTAQPTNAYHDFADLERRYDDWFRQLTEPDAMYSFA